MQIITDDAIERVFAGTNFGGCDRRKLVEQGVLKRLTGYSCGRTMSTILMELKLTTVNGTVTKLGKKFCCDAFYRQDHSA